MRDRSHLESIERFVEFSHGTRWNTLITDLDIPFKNMSDPIGYCYKYQGPAQTVYRVVCRDLGIEDVNYRVKMHEYGHIYFGHLDEVYAELDGLIYDAIKDNREELADYVNQSCGIDFGEELLERILDDPQMNHQIHNIAMDMEVNSKVLSDEDIEDLEKKITGVMMAGEIERLEKIVASATSEELKKAAEEHLKKARSQVMLKMILPSRYHDASGAPFPNELSYPEYLIMIIQHLDQFIKMLVNISMGGNGDTSNVTSEDIQDALQGGTGGAQSLSDLMDSMGCSGGNGNSSGSGNDNSSSGSGGSGNSGKYEGIRDHQSPDSMEADQERKDATDTGGSYSGRGGSGCGSSGGPGASHDVSKTVDPIEMSLEEVIQNFKSKVVEWKETRDIMWNWNLGINRTVISPAYKSKVSVKTQPTVVFLIDVSGSMDTRLVDRCLGTISRKMKRINGGLKYNIITWSTCLGEHIKDIDPKKPIPRILVGGGTSLASGIRYFHNNYDSNAILIIISDLEDHLKEWAKEEASMKDYTMYAFNYGYNTYRGEFKHIKVKNFSQR